MPLTQEDRAELYEEWKQRNPGVWAEIVTWAVEINASGRRVSTKYLVEKARYESRHHIEPVPFLDVYGNEHEYKINNTDTPLMARDLLAFFPDMNIELRKRAGE